MLAGVPAVGDTEPEVKIKRLEQPVSEVVSLYHSEVVDRFVSHCELNPEGGTRDRGTQSTHVGGGTPHWMGGHPNHSVLDKSTV